MNVLVKKFEETGGTKKYFSAYGDYLGEILDALDTESVHAICERFLEARKNGKTIYFAGNGGSAATASHFAQDLAEVGRKADAKSFKALSLTDNVPCITAVGNDYGFDDIFTIQMNEIFGKGDVLVVISASGNSPNVVKAARYAKELGGSTVGFVGFGGGELKEICDDVVHVVSNKGEYGPVEDVHMILDHMITSFLIEKLKGEA